MSRFKKGDRVVVRAMTLLVGEVKQIDKLHGKDRYLIDIEPRGGPIYCQEWELQPATALDNLVSELDLDG